nr:osteopetrosis-associated transmembrane protein 1-like [Lytechinus pictus]
MEPLFFISFLCGSIIFSASIMSISLFSLSLLLPSPRTLVAADSADSDKWMPGSTSGDLHSISREEGSLFVNPPGLKLNSNSNGQVQAAIDHLNPLACTQEHILVDIDNLPVDFTKCHHRKELLSAYSNASSAFIECAVKNAKPVLYCGQCVLEFDLSRKAWSNIENDEECKEDILVSDKLQIVSQTQAFLTQLWRDGNCQNCYDENLNFNATNSTQEFLKNYNDTMTCFLNNGGCSDDPVPVDSNMTLCDNCSEEYDRLNALYNDMSDDQLCMDIIDLMNRTRIMWKDNQCRKIEREFLAVVTLSVFVCILPLFFYITAMLHGTKKQQRLVEKSKERKRRSLSASARLYAGTTTSIR